MTLSWRVKNTKFVVWQTPVSGDKMAPFDNPELHLDRVWFASDFDYYKVAHHGVHSLTHASVAGKSQTFGTVVMAGQTIAQDQVLYTHGLGYVPRYMVAVGGVLIQNSHPVQFVSTDRVRTAAFYATATAIHCINHGTSSASLLASVAVDYELLLFRPPLDGFDPDLPVFSAKQGILAKGIIKASDILLRRADDLDASPFDIALGPAVDIDRGSMRRFLSDGTHVDFGPYGGSGVAPEYIQCAVTE
jgi:hypothetical protein